MANHKRRKRKKALMFRMTLLLLVIVGLFIVYLTVATKNKGQDKTKVTEQTAETTPVATAEATPEATPEPTPAPLDFSAASLQLNSAEYLLINATTNEVLAEKDSETRIYPASMTKIMTAILALENLSDLDQTITLPTEIFPALYEENASMAGFDPGETATVRELIYGVLLPSGGECCLTLSQRVAGSEAEFVALMNQKAQQIGMLNTNFCNSTGLHDEQHYTTAKDISVLLQYALQNGDFRAVFTKSRYSTGASNVHPDGFTFTSTMFKYLDSAQVTGGELLGGKTGYTGEAGSCLASLARIFDEDYILVTAGAVDANPEAHPHIDDAVQTYNKLGVALEKRRSLGQ